MNPLSTLTLRVPCFPFVPSSCAVTQKTLGDFLNDAASSPTAVNKREAWFDVPHRELFYKEEDLRCFRTNGTYIGDDCDPDDLEEEAAGTAPEPDLESKPPAVSVSSSADEAIRVLCRKEAEHTEYQEEGGEGPLPGTRSTGYDPAQTPEELCLGAAAFAAASAAYGRPSSSSSTPVASGGLVLPSQSGGGTNDSSEGSGNLPVEGNRVGRTRSSGRSRGSTAAASSSDSGNGSCSKKDHPTGSSRSVNKIGGHGGLNQQQRQRHERVVGKRQRGAATGDGGLTGTSVGDSSGHDPQKRRRAAGGVLVSPIVPGESCIASRLATSTCLRFVVTYAFRSACGQCPQVRTTRYMSSTQLPAAWFFFVW